MRSTRRCSTPDVRCGSFLAANGYLDDPNRGRSHDLPDRAERLLTPRPDDVGCAETFELIDRFVDLLVAGGDPYAEFHGIAAHLAGCGPCAEDFEGLLAAVRDPREASSDRFGKKGPSRDADDRSGRVCPGADEEVCVTTIAEQVEEMRASRPPRPAGEPLSPFEEEQARLAAAAPPDGMLAVGSAITDVDLLDVDGAPTTLYKALGDTTAVVVLYRGEWCPFCSIALRTYQAELVPALDQLEAHLVAISPQRPDGSLSTKEKNGLSFTRALRSRQPARAPTRRRHRSLAGGPRGPAFARPRSRRAQRRRHGRAADADGADRRRESRRSLDRRPP